MSVGAVVDLYCLPDCAKCASVQRWLNRLRLLVVVHDVADDDAARAEVERLGFRSLPVVVTADGHAAWGAEPDKLMAAMPQLAEAEQAATTVGRTCHVVGMRRALAAGTDHDPRHDRLLAHGDVEVQKWQRLLEVPKNRHH